MTVIDEIADERRRQVCAEGWTAAHDDTHTGGQMAAAAGCYAIGTSAQGHLDNEFLYYWPWQPGWWKPRNRRRDLVKAGALIVAEIERLDRISE